MDQSACCTRNSSRGMANRCGTIFLLHKALHDPLCTSCTRPTFTCQKPREIGFFSLAAERRVWCTVCACSAGAVGSWCTSFPNKPLSPKLRIQHLRSPGVEIVHVVSVSHVPVALAVRSPRARHPARTQVPAALARASGGGCGCGDLGRAHGARASGGRGLRVESRYAR